MFSRFPTDPNAPRGGVETVTLALVKALEGIPDLELHVVTLERSKRRPEVSSFGSATIHRLCGSRWPQMIDILLGPGRRRLKRYLVELDPDVVHLHETYGLCIGRLSVSHVFTVHGFDHANIPAERRGLAGVRSPIWRQIERWGLARQRHIISITPYVREYVAPLTDAVIYDIDNPIDPSFFEIPRAEVAGRIFFAGWISHRKNPLGLVQAFAKVLERGLDSSLHLAGEPKDRVYAQGVRDAIQGLGLGDRAVMLGRISPAQIRRELGEACVFALPARQENAPMAISEALAAGVPVVSSNVCGMPFMIQEGKTGYLVDPEDVDALADRLGRLLSDEAMRTQMGGAAREQARGRFHPDAVARKTLEVYRKIIAEAPNRRSGT